MTSDHIDNLIGAKVFSFGYYRFTSEQIKNEIIIPVINSQENKGLLRICFSLVKYIINNHSSP